MTRSRLAALGLTATLALAAAASPALAKTPKPRPSVSDISFTHHIDKPSPVLLGFAPSSSPSRGRYQLRLSDARGV
jgi:polyisoprenoid-binding protein YceI